MGTFVALSVDGPSAAVASAGLESAWEAIRRVEALMHPTRAGGDLARLHAAGVGERVPVHAWTMALLREVARLYRDSQGVFDPCRPDAAGRYADLQLGDDDTLARRAPLRLDLGGVAKGYAVDRAIEAIAATGCTAARVNAGGDVRLWGGRAETLTVGRTGGVQVALRDAALAVSAESATAPPEHLGYYCRAPGYRRTAAAAAVIAPTATLADALTKCVLFMSAGECAALLARHGARRVQLP